LTQIAAAGYNLVMQSQPLPTTGEKPAYRTGFQHAGCGQQRLICYINRFSGLL